VVDDAVVLDLDPGRELVGEPEPVGGPQGLEVVDGVGRWVVIVGDPGLERQLGQAADGLGGDP
jgi:hypothetical protein